MAGSTSFPGALDGFTTNYSDSSPQRHTGPDIDNHSAALNAVETRLANSPNVYNVTHPTYGAVAGTDCTTAIQAAIDACSTAGGGVVFVPASTSPYKISNIKLKSKVWLEGAGAGTELRSIVSNPGASGSGLISLNSVNETDVWVSDLVLGGLKGSQSNAIDGIDWDMTGVTGDKRWRIFNLYIYQTKGSGIHFTGRVGAGFMREVYIGGCDGHGVHFDATGPCGDNAFVNCGVVNSGLNGWHDAGGGGFNRFIGCGADYSGLIDAVNYGDGFYLSSHASLLVGCRNFDNKRHAYHLSTASALGNRLVDCEAGRNLGSAFRLTDAVDNYVTGWVPYEAGGSGQHDHIVDFSGSPTRNHVDVAYMASALTGGHTALNGTSSSSAYAVRVVGASPAFTVT